MCGFSGIYGKKDIINKTVLDLMSERLAHRGPDDEGVEIIPIGNGSELSLGLAHRRLSVIDLSEGGHQPMCNEVQTIWIVYNGEIYNYTGIRDRLKAKGYRFKSNSDTEVVIHAYEEWGTECLQEFRGMFAFAIFDTRKEVLFLAVDRFGIKPLYYCDEGDGPFIFSSEIRAILNSGITKRSIESQAVDSFLAYGAVQAPLTIIEEVYSLLPAHYLILNLDTRDLKIVKYWSPADNLSAEPLDNEDQAVQRLKHVLQDSIERHLVSDVPVGLFLSGGIDSSSIVALANTLNEGTLQSFSVTFSESAFSEGKYSRLIASKYCKDHTEIKMSVEDLLGFLPHAIQAMDQPTINGINIYAISKVVRERGIKVVLSGQGGDEVFGGYSTFKRIPIIDKSYNLIALFPISMRAKIGEMIDSIWERHIIGAKMSRILESDWDIISFYLILRQLFSPKARKELMEKDCYENLSNGLLLPAAESLISEIEQLDTFSKISLLEMRLYLANMLLRDGDFMGMAHGLEVRVPFLDAELVNLVFNVSSTIKKHNTLPKPFLLKAMGKLLPQEIYRRPKMGFVFPWDVWLKNQLRSEIEELINEFPENNEIGLNMKTCQYLWRMFIRNASGITWAQIWAIYVLIRWYQENVSGN